MLRSEPDWSLLPPTTPQSVRRPNVAIAPDGSFVVYVAVIDGDQRLYLRRADSLEGEVLTDLRRVASPFVSPDGQWIGFYDDQNDALEKVSIRGGRPITLCNSSWLHGASLQSEDSIVTSMNGPDGLHRVAAGGGTPELLVDLDTVSGDSFFLRPQILPGGRHLLFTVIRGGEREVAMYSLESGRRQTILTGVAGARYVATGHLVFGREKSPRALPRLTLRPRFEFFASA